MYMADWIRKLVEYLKLSDRDVLDHAGSVSHDDAVRRAERELDRFDAERAKLPSPIEQDFDEAMREVESLAKMRKLSGAKRPSKRKRDR